MRGVSFHLPQPYHSPLSYQYKPSPTSLYDMGALAHWESEEFANQLDCRLRHRFRDYQPLLFWTRDLVRRVHGSGSLRSSVRSRQVPLFQKKHHPRAFPTLSNSFRCVLCLHSSMHLIKISNLKSTNQRPPFPTVKLGLVYPTYTTHSLSYVL